MSDIKIGDLVETCSLMPGVVMKKEVDDIEVRMLHIDEYLNDSYANCSLKHCGIVKLTVIQALNRLNIGKEKLAKHWAESASYEDYQKRIGDI